MSMTLSYGTSADSNVLSVMGVDRVKGLSLEEIESADQEQKESQADSVVNQNRGQQHFDKRLDKANPYLDPGPSCRGPLLVVLFAQIIFIPAPTKMPVAATPTGPRGVPCESRQGSPSWREESGFADRGAPMMAIAVEDEPLLSMSPWRHGTINTYGPLSIEKIKTNHLFALGLARCASEAKELSLVTDPSSRIIHKGTSCDVLLIL
uniref:Uncharacterized protein n=1 Tax=Gibberella zeae (strain ATCC MYA-4620 / CBS 123657 / FGSC 9075 / NRRL 31084 / PH-1) TaxID=229533 RepID=A0A098DRF6_GIBZE